MSRPTSELSRTLSGRDAAAGDGRARLLALVPAIGECARELERGAAIQPAAEELLAARRALQGSPIVLLQGADDTAVRAFLQRTLAIHSRPGVALQTLPDCMVLHMEDGATATRRLFWVRHGADATLPAAAAVPAYVRIEIAAAPVADVADLVPDARLLSVRVWVAPAEDGAFESSVGLRAGAHLQSAEPTEFWQSRLYADAALVEALRLQRSASCCTAALETLKRRVLLLRQEQQLAQSLFKVHEPRRPATARGGSDNALRLVSETVSELIASVRERGRRAAARGSWLWSFQANALAQIGRESIARDERRKITRLAVNEEQIRGIEASFLRTFRGMLSKDLEALRAELDGLCRALEKQLQLPPRGMAYEFPADQALWNDVAGHAVVDVRYRGEIPRRGFMERLAEGRKMVFLLLMVGSLAGSFVGFNLRQSGLIGLVCLALFVGTIAWSYKSWSDEENELIDRETDKVTDLVEAAILKATSESLREATGCMVSALESARKQLLLRIEATHERQNRESDARLAGEQRDLLVRQTRTDALLRQLQALEPQLQRHTQAAEQIAADAARSVQAALRPEGAR